MRICCNQKSRTTFGDIFWNIKFTFLWLSTKRKDKKKTRRMHKNENALLCWTQLNGQLVSLIIVQFINEKKKKSLFKMGFSKGLWTTVLCKHRQNDYKHLKKRTQTAHSFHPFGSRQSIVRQNAILTNCIRIPEHGNVKMEKLSSHANEHIIAIDNVYIQWINTTDSNLFPLEK